MRAIGIVLAAAVLAAATPAGARRTASQFTVVAQVSPGAVPNGGTATLTAHTRIGADCAIGILYDDGSAGPSLPGQHVGQSGIIRWSWAVHTSASGGDTAVACTSKGIAAVGQARFGVGGGSAASQPTQVPAPAVKGKVIITWSGQSANKSFSNHSPSFTVRGPFTVHEFVAAIDPTKVASADPPSVFNDVKYTFDPFPDLIAIDVGQRPVVAQMRVTDNQCQFGCTLFVSEANNVRWTLTVTQ